MIITFKTEYIEEITKSKHIKSYKKASDFLDNWREIETDKPEKFIIFLHNKAKRERQKRIHKERKEKQGN